MTADIGWEFPVDGADQWQGFNDPGIEHFRGSPFGSLAREIIQNSLDASTGATVNVSFQLLDIPTSDIPGIDQLRDTIKRCEGAEGNEGKKAKDFFSTAIRLLSGKKLPVLSIVETNTAGIRGPCRNGTPYFAYMKATGQSKKDLQDGNAVLGSYGLASLHLLRCLIYERYLSLRFSKMKNIICSIPKERRCRLLMSIQKRRRGRISVIGELQRTVCQSKLDIPNCPSGYNVPRSLLG